MILYLHKLHFLPFNSFQRDTRKKLSPSAVERYCDRCSLLYKVDKWGFPTTTGPCVYHWGRAYKRRGYSGLETRYSCCGGDLESDGCVQATTHVSQNYNPDDLRGYVRTLPKESSSGDYGVYALGKLTAHHLSVVT